MLYCSLGLSRDDITVRGLLKFNHDLEGVIDGPKDRYMHVSCVNTIESVCMR
jgi:hypothetical protein